jgi:hypothetical protein
MREGELGFAHATEVPSEAAVFLWFCGQFWDHETM